MITYFYSCQLHCVCVLKLYKIQFFRFTLFCLTGIIYLYFATLIGADRYRQNNSTSKFVVNYQLKHFYYVLDNFLR